MHREAFVIANNAYRCGGVAAATTPRLEVSGSRHKCQTLILTLPRTKPKSLPQTALPEPSARVVRG